MDNNNIVTDLINQKKYIIMGKGMKNMTNQQNLSKKWRIILMRKKLRNHKKKPRSRRVDRVKIKILQTICVDFFGIISRLFKYFYIFIFPYFHIFVFFYLLNFSFSKIVKFKNNLIISNNVFKNIYKFLKIDRT